MLLSLCFSDRVSLCVLWFGYDNIMFFDVSIFRIEYLKFSLFMKIFSVDFFKKIAYNKIKEKRAFQVG